MSRAQKEARVSQVVDGGGEVNQSKVDYGDDGEEPWLNSIVKAGAQFYMQKELGDSFGESLGEGLSKGDSDSGSDEE